MGLFLRLSDPELKVFLNILAASHCFITFRYSDLKTFLANFESEIWYFIGHVFLKCESGV
jgi:hypothetical protein